MELMFSPRASTLATLNLSKSSLQQAGSLLTNKDIVDTSKIECITHFTYKKPITTIYHTFKIGFHNFYTLEFAQLGFIISF